MSSLNKDERFLKCLENIEGNLSSGKELVNCDLLFEFQSNVKNFADNISEIKNTERVLKIGIVGEVKAGKSSFLNSLIFSGESVLPKAPTPMTAALTKLGYSEKPSVKIVFYTDYDWDRIKDLSSEYDNLMNKYLNDENRKYEASTLYSEYMSPRPTVKSIEEKYKNQIPTQYTVCKELTKMVDEKGIILNNYLGKTLEIKNLSSDTDYMKELENYVGTNGEFTPIVKHTEILINNPLLKEIEVIDTPGLNDPILSRSETTKKFLINCDVVFLLSYVGQFLTSEDIQFLAQTLPGEGIRKAILIGSKFDSGVLDYKKRDVTFIEAVFGSKKNFDLQARNNVQSCAKSQNCSAAIRAIEKSLPPKYISSLMYSAGSKVQKNKALSEEEEHIITQLKKRFKGFKDSPDFLIDFSNIDNIRKDVFSELKNEKDKIISERIATITNSQNGKFIAILEDININAKNNLADLSKYDFAQLQEKVEKLTEKLDSIRSEVKNLFEYSGVSAQKILSDIATDIQKEVDNFTNIPIIVTTETHRVIEHTGFLGLKREACNVHETINSANISEAISNLRKYANRTKEYANEEFTKLFDVDNLKRNVKKTIIGAFDLTNKNFNENDILIPLEITLKKLTIPKIEINYEDYSEIISRRFSSSGVVEGNQISELKLAQEQALGKMAKYITDEILNTGVSIESILNEQAGVFVDSIENQLNGNVKILRTLLADKENSIIEYKTFISNIAEYKGQIREFKE